FSRDWSSDVCSSDLRLRDGPAAGDVAGCGAEEVNDADAALEALAAGLDELAGGPLKPGRRHPAVVVPDGREALPVTAVAPDDPRSEERRVGQEARAP